MHGGKESTMIVGCTLRWAQSLQARIKKAINCLIAMEEGQIDFY
jgi:hypothetical protein